MMNPRGSRRSSVFWMLLSPLLVLAIVLLGGPPNACGQEDDQVRADATCLPDDGTAAAMSGLDGGAGNSRLICPDDNLSDAAEEDEVEPTPGSRHDGHADAGHVDVVEAANADDDKQLGVAQNLDGGPWNLDEEEIRSFLQETRGYVMAKVVSADDDDGGCTGRHENCAIWSLIGECETNPNYMREHCSPYCRSCSPRCYYKENGPDVWTDPGDLDKTFRRIVSRSAVAEISHVGGGGDDGTIPSIDVLSSPDDPDNGPWVVAIDDFLVKEEAERLIELGAIEGYVRSELYEEGVTQGRTSSNSWCMESCQEDPVVQSVASRISKLIGIDESYTEPFQLLKYEEGEFYEAHHDYVFLDDTPEEEAQEGHRIVTAFLYLNDVEAGGATTFVDLNITVLPKRGRLLLWPSVLDESPREIDWRTEHEAEVVTTGRKYGANLWFHTRPYRKAFEVYVCKDGNGNEQIMAPPDDDD